MKINELGYPNEPLVVEEPIANESPFISEKASGIGETVPQDDPKEKKKKPKDMTWDVDGEAVMLELYNDSKSLIQAKRKIAVIKPARRVFLSTKFATFAQIPESFSSSESK